MKTNIKRHRIFSLLVILSALCFSVISGGSAMTNTAVLYRVALENEKNRTIVVKQSGKKIILALEGFGQNIELKATGGGISTCRTIIKHNSDKTTVILSLQIPDPRAPCRMLPGFVSIESRVFNISLDEEKIKKISGRDAKLRSVVEKSLGKIEEEEE